ncbi:hypothetical protein TNCV_5117391 [Trichonephila clavipes]|nr:hypothetical protein TNCV_5117391 [Trichonephila clavipes]
MGDRKRTDRLVEPPSGHPRTLRSGGQTDGHKLIPSPPHEGCPRKSMSSTVTKSGISLQTWKWEIVNPDYPDEDNGEQNY